MLLQKQMEIEHQRGGSLGERFSYDGRKSLQIECFIPGFCRNRGKGRRRLRKRMSSLSAYKLTDRGDTVQHI